MFHLRRLFFLCLPAPLAPPFATETAPGKRTWLRLATPVLLLAASLAASLFSLYLVYLQFFVIKELCDYCMLSALVNWSVSALLLWNHF